MPSRKPVKRPLPGIFFALPAVLFASWLAAAVDDSAGSWAHPDPGIPSTGIPSTFDYLVLASLADSPQLHAMAGFRPSATQRSEPQPKEDQSLKAEDWPH
jgi:hypothetical protein